MLKHACGDVSRAVSLLKLSSDDARYLKNLQKSTQEQDEYGVAYKHGLDAVAYHAMMHSLPVSELKELIKVGVPDLPINATDIMAAFKLAPGQQVGKLMRDAERFWCELRFKASKDEVLEFLRLGT